MSETPTNPPVPEISRFLLRGFRRYSRRMIRKQFHAVALLREGLAQARGIAADQPLIVYGNHPGWWDPLAAHLVCETCFPDRDFFAPIDAAALQRYRILARLGFYPLEMGTATGAANFLRCSRAILDRPAASLWLTPEGRFCDPRDRSAELMPGLAHLCSRFEQGAIVPLAIEYPFWEERLPEMLMALGDPIDVAAHREMSKSDWRGLLTQRLRATQDQLARVAIDRDTEALEIVLRGGRGSGAGYDLARRFRSLFSGTRYQASHGGKLQ
ncbi:lysophospholipid acyltransferase family protein [Rosistilla oblonga]|uniref:lysophospholipid acyltransferase family protein n=1 Tax=Rosistilla oblonga TaxID=2527990 RepID=UPI003A97C966